MPDTEDTTAATTYEVVGTHHVAGAAPGETVVLPDTIHVDALIRSGHIRPTSKRATAKKTSPANGKDTPPPPEPDEGSDPKE